MVMREDRLRNPKCQFGTIQFTKFSLLKRNEITTLKLNKTLLRLTQLSFYFINKLYY
jgi:hypothetical protein